MTELHFESLGEGPPLLILHGLFGSGTNWRRIARRLSSDMRVLLVDARNHGRSPHTASMTYPEMVDDLISLMDRLDISRASLLGHSMGGKTAMLAALHAPTRVHKLVVADIAPVVYQDHDHAPLIAAMRALRLEALSNRAQADTQLAKRLPDRALRAFLLHNLESTDKGYRWRINLDAIEHGIGALFAFDTSDTSAFLGPCLFLRGAASDYVGEQSLAAIRKLFPGSSLVTIEGAGHWLHADNPDAFSQQVLEFLTEQGCS